MKLQFFNREDPPEGKFFTEPLILKLSNDTYVFGNALMKDDGRVHDWFWGRKSSSEACHKPLKVVQWAVAPTVDEIVKAAIGES